MRMEIMEKEKSRGLNVFKTRYGMLKESSKNIA